MSIEKSKNVKLFYERIDVLLGLVIVCLISYLLFLYFKKSNGINLMPFLSVTTTPAVAPFQSAFDGSGVATEAEVYPQVLGVMVDNHPDARPQAGLAEARVVYEAPAEGGITRYLAIFSKDANVAKVGPVRSARPYYMDWLREYGEIPYLHSGGSPEALAFIKQIKLWDANEFFYGQYYWRDSDRLAPHNLYTSSEKWQAFFARYGSEHTKTAWEGWTFSTVVTASSSIGKMAIAFTPTYEVSWQYDVVAKQYIRYINSELQRTQTGERIVANNIIVEEVPMKTLDEVGRKEFSTIGSGSARVFRQGTLVRGKWKKINAAGRTKLFDESGKEITLVPGVTWVEIVPVNTPVTVAN